jgi:hypothetical protein
MASYEPLQLGNWQIPFTFQKFCRYDLGDKELAGFFFWNSGTSMQMSRMGLLQSLIHKATRDDPELMPYIFHRLWRSYTLFGGNLHPWSWAELTQAFKLWISDDSRRFFFSIDGLDEFDGNTVELTQFLLEISCTRPDVQLCIASRP